MIEITMSERQQEYLRAFMQPRIVGLERAIKALEGTAPEREAQELYNIVMGPMQEVGESPESPEDESSEDSSEKEKDPSEDPSQSSDLPLEGTGGTNDQEEVPADPFGPSGPHPPTPAEEEDTSNPEGVPADTGPGEAVEGPVYPLSDKPAEPANVRAGAMQPGTIATGALEELTGKGKHPRPKGSAHQGLRTTSDLKDAAS